MLISDVFAAICGTHSGIGASSVVPKHINEILVIFFRVQGSQKTRVICPLPETEQQLENTLSS